MRSLLAYQQVRHLIKTGDALEWSSPGAVGGAIRLITGNDVNHTSLCLDLAAHGCITEPHKYILEANPGGIEPKLLSRRLEEFKGSVWWLQLKPEFAALRNDGIDWALEQEGIPYDYKSVFRQLIGSVSADSKNFFCSEYNFIYLVVSGILPQYVYSLERKVVLDRKTGKVVKAPVPGNFGQFNVYYNRRQIL